MLDLSQQRLLEVLRVQAAQAGWRAHLAAQSAGPVVGR